MDFRTAIKKFFQFGGFRLVKEYAKLGVIPEVARGIIKRKSLKSLYYVALNILEPYLKDKYSPLMLERKACYDDQILEHERSKIVWFCWLQGIEQAPPIVKACLASLKQHLTDREIKIVTNDNWHEYVDLPDHIIERWEKKEMPPALFSDILRLQLLIRYGGTWIDSTVLCTGTEYAQKYLDADLFMFQYTAPEEYPSSFRGISNWFISSYTNNVLLLTLRDMLYAYWKDFDCTLDYYIFHYFFALLVREYPDLIKEMPYGYSVWSITLVEHWGEPFNQKKWDKLTSIVNFHKLAYTIDQKMKEDKGNFYNWILEKYR